MSFLSLFIHYVWILNALIEATLLWLVARRRLYQQFPFFVLYLTWVFSKTVVLLAMDFMPSFTGDQYFYAYMIARTGVAALVFGVLYELFTKTLCNYPALRNLGSNLLRLSCVILLLLATALAWLVPAAGTGQRMAELYLLERTVSILQIGLLLFLFVFSRYLGVSWRSRAFGIALGFGILASVTLATTAIRSQVEPVVRSGVSDIIDLINEGALLSCNLIWLGYMLGFKSTPLPPPRLPDDDLGPWNQELRRLL